MPIFERCSKEKSPRKYSPQYGRSTSRRHSDISEAETSADYRERKWDRDPKFQRIIEERDQRSKRSKQRSKSKHRERRSSDRKSKRHSRSFDNLNNSSHYFQSTGFINQKDQKNKREIQHKQRSDFDSRDKKFDSQEVLKSKCRKIIQKIQKIDYQNLNFNQLRDRFHNQCRDHVKFFNIIPEAWDNIGLQLLKDGIFHQMWAMALKKSQTPHLDELFQSYYVEFQPKIEKNLSNFEKMFNPVPEDDETISPEMTFKRYRKTVEENTRSSTTKIDVMIAFQQVKHDIKSAQIEQNLVRKVQKSIEDFKLKSDQKRLHLDVDPNLNDWFNDDKSKMNWSAKEDQQRKQEQIERIKKSRIREKSPLSNRFRMMHEVQSNQRRMNVEMACVFLRLDTFYFFSDLHIVRIDEAIFSENQEILVMKAYTVEFCPSMGKMKIEPKLKNLIAVYKFCGLQELTRLQKTHGKFDGIVVYPECFNAQKYLASSKQLSLLKDDYLQQIREQLPEQGSHQSSTQSNSY